MDISDLKRKKKESGLTNQEIAELSKVPVSTVNKIFSGTTKNPRYGTLLAIEEVLATKKEIPFRYDELREEPVLMRDAAAAYQYRARIYVGDDIEQLSESMRAELVLGQLYMLAAPSRRHQYLITELLFQIRSYIRMNQGRCHVYPAPFDVRLFKNESVIVQPDISVVCDKDKLSDRGCEGAPDWVIEIVSPGNRQHDYVTKLMQYQKSGVREYWIVDQQEGKVMVYNFENPARTAIYGMEESVPSGVLCGLEIEFTEE
ncbi:Uma2 family endonuclease [Bariatricus sp. SGI.154]|uniref:Uma2 family endonuclease n=1 Tax=Bariatricus sp. SGI.154 TaxID=3420549 RepID=UPI003D06532D